jgi:hypothetical protein
LPVDNIRDIFAGNMPIKTAAEAKFLRGLLPHTGANYNPCEETRKHVCGISAISITAPTGTGKTRILSQMTGFGVQVGASDTTRRFMDRDSSSEFPYHAYHDTTDPNVRNFVRNIILKGIPVQVEQHITNKHAYFLLPEVILPGVPLILELQDTARRNVARSRVFNEYFEAYITPPSYGRNKQAIAERGDKLTPEEELNRAVEAYLSMGRAICDQNVIFIRTDYDDQASGKVDGILKGSYTIKDSEVARGNAIEVHKEMFAEIGPRPDLGVVAWEYPITA